MNDGVLTRKGMIEIWQPYGTMEYRNPQHSPLMQMLSDHIENLMKHLKLDMAEWLGKYVSHHFVSRDIFDSDMVKVGCLTDKVEVDINVFCPCMELGVLGQLDCALVVAVEWSGLLVAVEEG